MALSLRKKRRDKFFESFIKDCQQNLSGTSSLLFNYPFKEHHNLSQIVKYFRKQNKDKNFISKIKKIYDLKYKTVKYGYPEFRKIIMDYKFSKNDLLNYKRATRIITYSKNTKNKLFKYITKILAFNLIGNFSHAQKIIVELTTFSKIHFVNSFQRNDFSGHDISEVRKTFENAYHKINLKVKDPEIRRVVANSFYSLFENKKSSFSGNARPWSLSEIREIVQSPFLSQTIPGYWAERFLKRSTKKEAIAFIEQGLNSHYFFTRSLNDLWIYSLVYPKMEIRRKFLVSESLAAWKKDDSVDYLILLLAENKTFKDGLSKLNRDFSSTLFNIKRNHFNRRLRNGRSIDFSIYNLLELGSQEEEFLWWIIL